MRQPQVCSSASLRVEDNSAPKPEPSSELMPWLANCQLATKPRRPGMCSTRNAVELPNSPPAEKPCTRRATMTSSGASTPILSKVGMHATASVPKVIIAMDSSSDALRPWRSA